MSIATALSSKTPRIPAIIRHCRRSDRGDLYIQGVRSGDDDVLQARDRSIPRGGTDECATDGRVHLELPHPVLRLYRRQYRSRRQRCPMAVELRATESSSTLSQPTHSYGIAGTYTVTLVVKDNGDAVGTISKPVTVTAPPPINQPPVAIFTSSCSGLSCTFTNGSTDDGSVTASSWDFGDNSGSSAIQNPTYTYAAGGSYEVTLTVTDNMGTIGTVKHTVTVTVPPPPNQPPVADFTPSCADLTCTFTDNSADDGSVTAWIWNFGDNSGSAAIQNPAIPTRLEAATR